MTSRRSPEAFHAHLVDDGTQSPPLDDNVAPTTIQPIIRNSRDTGDRELVSLRWGLIPFVTKDIKEVKGISTTMPAPRRSQSRPPIASRFKKRRCLVPASGFYECKRLDEKNKQPFAFDLLNGQWLQSYTIITTDANELMAKVHDRIPVILYPGDYERWLCRDPNPAHPPIDLLRPFLADEMEVFEVSKEVGNVKKTNFLDG